MLANDFDFSDYSLSLRIKRETMAKNTWNPPFNGRDFLPLFIGFADT